ncbi:sugar ABC transporter ATP-binding protein [Cryptosporangium aurantiacum]|uniref:Monosaccharide ABC transporter ATP-binding protein, CUT2 family n=1 Tax=Cryptosporangium aurantiacum TaxID=134849 RepID=A0A1M7Q4I2_9ACTN|nr:sugar ABC transporter ATP-binding protein [Cryptosporangium aurantiacum]SHN25222.1 monosaccharide ABC transporter ATP-binding protein, CUT2 family [Cryptosporangium aurantiacum]
MTPATGRPDDNGRGPDLTPETTARDASPAAGATGTGGASVAENRAAPLLRLSGIVKTFPGVRALDGVDLTVLPGEVHCLLGQNGAGKSTLIKVLSGAHQPDEGSIEWLGEPVRFTKPTAALRAGLATIYQELDLVDDLTVAENVFLGHEPRRLGFSSRGVARRRARELLARLGHGEIPVGREVGRLPAAGKQIVSMARALSHDARLIIMDEPSAVLAHDEVENLFRVIRDLTSAGVAVIYISHRLAEIRDIGDRVTILKDGRTVAVNLPARTTPTAEVVRLMTGRNVEYVFPARRGDRADAPSAAPGDTAPASGDSTGAREDASAERGDTAAARDAAATRDGTAATPRVETAAVRAGVVRGPEAAAPLLRVTGLGRPGEFEGISFSVRAGEIVGLAGLVGAGRSEILEAVYGARKSATGTVEVDGKTLRRGSVQAAVAAGMGLAPEERKSQALLLGEPVYRNVALASLRRFSRLGFLRRGLERAEVSAVTSSLDLRPADPRRVMRTLSGGNQQKAVVSRWLLGRTRLLLLDEPTRGVDIGARAELYALIRSLADQGVGVLMVSSEVPEVLGLADRVLVVREGHVVHEAPASELTEAQVLDLVMAGERVTTGR